MNFSKLNEVTKGNTRTTGISPFMELELSKVFPNPNQPRKSFALAEIMELAESIKQNGLMQPIVVSKIDKKYIIVSGERRYKAHLHAKISTIKAHIIDADENKILELALVENIIREDLTDMEISLHVNKLWLSGRYSDKGGLAIAIGKSATYISKALSVIKLDEEIIKHIKETNSSIGLSVLNEIATIKEPEVQKEVYSKYTNGEITRDGIANIKAIKKHASDWDKFEKGDVSIEYERIDVVGGVACIKIEKHIPITLNGDSEGNFTVFVFLEDAGSRSVVEQTSGLAISNAKTPVLALNAAQTIISRNPDAYRKGLKERVRAKEKIKEKLQKKSLKDASNLKNIQKHSKDLQDYIEKNAPKPMNSKDDMWETVSEDKIEKPTHSISRVWDTVAEESMAQSIKEMQQEIDELQTKEVYIVSYAHKKGTPHGGGHRLRALNKDEAIELGKEYYTKKQGVDKKYIFSAATLKEIEDDIKSHKKCVVVCLGSKNSESEDFTFMADDGVHTKLEGYLKIDGLKAHKGYIVTIEEI